MSAATAVIIVTGEKHALVSNDDLIVLISGAQTNPRATDMRLVAKPLVAVAYVENVGPAFLSLLCAQLFATASPTCALCRMETSSLSIVPPTSTDTSVRVRRLSKTLLRRPCASQEEAKFVKVVRCGVPSIARALLRSCSCRLRLRGQGHSVGNRLARGALP